MVGLRQRDHQLRPVGRVTRLGAPRRRLSLGGLPSTLWLWHQSQCFVLCSPAGGHHWQVQRQPPRCRRPGLLWTRGPQGSPAETTATLTIFKVNIASPDLGHGKSLGCWRDHQNEPLPGPSNS